MLETIRTGDIALATYLCMEGFEIDELLVASPGLRPVVEFVINPGRKTFPQLQSARSRYESNKATVEPRQFARRFRETRDILFEFLQDQRDLAG